jgi:putative intracellular protease/amidase
MNERRTSADFVAAVCALSDSGSGTISALVHGAASLSGAGTEELRHAVSGHYPERDAPGRLDELASRWSAPCLTSLAVAIRSGTERRSGGLGGMRDYLVACAVADATGAIEPTG